MHPTASPDLSRAIQSSEGKCQWTSSRTFEVDHMGAHAKLAEQRCCLGGAHPLDGALDLSARIPTNPYACPFSRA